MALPLKTIKKIPLRKILLALFFVPAICTAQKYPCKDISRKANEDNNTVTYQSPALQHLTVLKQTLAPAFFALHIRLSNEYPDFDGTGLVIEFEDGTILKDEACKVDCKEEAAMISSGDIGTSSANSAKYILQAFYYITAESIEKFSTQKIVRVQLHERSQKIQAKEATAVLSYTKCLQDIKW